MAAEILGRHLKALQLRYLETLTVMATDSVSEDLPRTSVVLFC